MKKSETFERNYEDLKLGLVNEIISVVSKQPDSLLNIDGSPEIVLNVIDDQESETIQEIEVKETAETFKGIVRSGVYEPDNEYDLEKDFEVPMLLLILKTIEKTLEEK